MNTLECPKVMDEIEFWIKAGVFILRKDWQLLQNPNSSYTDCVNYKENYKKYISETKKIQKDWEKEQKQKKKQWNIIL